MACRWRGGGEMSMGDLQLKINVENVWRPIATAPKNAPVLVFSADSRDCQIFIAHYVGDKETSWQWYDYWREDGCWPIDVELTHWMWLPEAPIC